jgi:two-component system phosphate regulon sensor histidine kinase PhoR
MDNRPGEIQAARLRTLVVLVLCFAVLPGALLLSVGILVLVFGHQPHDYVFGILIVSLAAVLAGGILATLSYVRRSTSLARLQAEFVQRVSHDLRTPLTSIRMFVETLQSGRLKDPERVAECLDVIAEETGRLAKMVERLLGWARMEAGKRVFHKQRATVLEIVERALTVLDVEVMLAQLRERGKLVIEPPAQGPSLVVDVDIDAMVEALVNLLQNAVRYTGDDKVIGVRIDLRDQEALITVTDNGPGIPKQDQGKIFEKFYRVIDPADPNVNGSGLGLAIVHQIVRAHRGSVVVDSDVGRGAAFTIALPVVEEPASALLPAEAI